MRRRQRLKGFRIGREGLCRRGRIGWIVGAGLAVVLLREGVVAVAVVVVGY